MSKILLLHGAWHNEKCWDKVAKILNDKGYKTQVLTLPGNGDNDSKDVSYDDYITCVVESINKQTEKVIVVGHSSAGHILQMSIPKVVDKVEKVIFNNAWLLPDGKSQFDFVPDDIKTAMRQAAMDSGTGAIPIDPGFVRGMLATEASEEIAQALMAILVEQPLVIMETSIDAKAFYKLTLPMALLYNTKDMSVAPGAYLEMFKALGDHPVIEVECDHEGLFTDPETYTNGLIEAINI